MTQKIEPGTVFRFRPVTHTVTSVDPPKGAICVVIELRSKAGPSPLWLCRTFDNPGKNYAAYEHEMEVLDET